MAQKLSMQSPDLADEKFAQLAALFPNAVTEYKDENGCVVRAIDKDVLSQEIAAHVLEGREERYQFTWPDKREAIRRANEPSTQCLRPCREESVDFDNTKNLYIEGDNLEVLKLLRENYLGKVKMIYIDPPYNTGNDFVYNDDFAESVDSFKERDGQKDELGNRLFKNTDSNGRFHTDWLNMMYPRLKVARDLLSEDGVIFISIDENEVENLKKLCNEIIGEDNFVSTIHCQMSTTQGMKVKAAQDGNIVKNAEYILCYSKDGHKNIARESLLYDLRPKYDEHYSLYLKKDGTIAQLSELYDYRNPKDCGNQKKMTLEEAYRKSDEFADIVRTHLADIVRTHLADIVRTDKVTGFDIGLELKNGYWKEVERNGKKYLLTKDAKGNVRQLLRLSDSWGRTDGYYEESGLRKIRGDWWEGFYIDMGNVAKEGNVDFKNGKKPVRLIKQLSKMVAGNNAIVLDFFSGSATTAHAVMKLNAEDGGNRRFIMVQLPELTDEKSEAYKAGYKNICEIGKERIRRAGEAIRNEELGKRNEELLDVGFRVLKLDSSNMKDVYYRPEEIGMGQRDLFEENIKEDRSAEDLLFQVMPELGIELSVSIRKEDLGIRSEELGMRNGVEVFNVGDGYLMACFDNELDEEIITEIAKRKPAYFVTRDRAFGNDAMAVNMEQIFTKYSPDTVRRVI